MSTQSAASATSFPHALFAGRTTLDALYWLDELPAEDTKVFARAFRIAPGGPACNAAITHALLGGRTTLLSAIGRGPWADLVRNELDRRSVRLVDLAPTTYQTPFTTVLVNARTSTRTIVNPPVEPVDVPPLNGSWNSAWGDPPRLALSDGFNLKQSLALLGALRDLGTAVCLDGGSWKPGTETLAPMLTAAICSERFSIPAAMPDAETTLAWFAAQGVPHAAVTRGPKPIIGVDRGRRFEIEIEPVEAIDTSGAGDVLHGAFCFYFAATGDFEESLRRAAEVATLSCRGLGVVHWADQEATGPARD